MKLGKLLHAKDRATWRAWLEKHHESAKEIWLVYYNKASGRPRIPYNDAVEEALCFGWIDSIVKKVDEHRAAQRFSPRRPKSKLSPMNEERIRRLVAAGRMRPAGLAAVRGLMSDAEKPRKSFTVPPDILAALEADPAAWKNFRRFPDSYQRIRIGWIDAARIRPEVFATRLRYFLKMTAQGKQFGMVR
jgi:uncharacterized protein YdeI (YjbR/CyaY-like superfamily)